MVVAGWSYGGTVISIAADSEPSVTRLVYVNNVPAPVRDFGYSDWIDQDPHVLTYPDGTFALDNDWWLNEDDGPTFPPEVLSHLRRHARRRVTRKSMSDPQPAAAWRSIPTTVVLGRFDDQPGANDIAGAVAHRPPHVGHAHAASAPRALRHPSFYRPLHATTREVEVTATRPRAG